MKKIIFIIFLSSLLFSCTKNIEFNGEQEDPLLVANSIINPDSLVEVFVSKSTFFLDKMSADSITNAVVKIFEEETEVSQLHYVMNGKYRTESFKPKANTEYRIEVEAPGFEKVHGEASFPTKVPILEFDTTSQYYYNQLDYIEVELKFQDPANEENFYRIDAFMEMWEWLEDEKSYHYYKQKLWINTDDPVIVGVEGENTLFGDSYNEYNIFDDTYISGKTYTLNVEAYAGNLYKNHENDKFLLTFSLESISKDMFTYLKSRTLHDANEENPFVEPVPVFSNIINGIGFFGGFSTSSISFEHEGVSYYY